jgi:hypothetical protein
MSLYKDRSIAEEGHITLPEAPGLGLSLNEDALEYYASGPWGVGISSEVDRDHHTSECRPPDGVVGRPALPNCLSRCSVSRADLLRRRLGDGEKRPSLGATVFARVAGI